MNPKWDNLSWFTAAWTSKKACPNMNCKTLTLVPRNTARLQLLKCSQVSPIPTLMISTDRAICLWLKRLTCRERRWWIICPTILHHLMVTEINQVQPNLEFCHHKKLALSTYRKWPLKFQNSMRTLTITRSTGECICKTKTLLMMLIV